MANFNKTFSKIYDECLDRIYRFVFIKVNSQEVAEDLTSETFTKCWECLKNGEKIENYKAFLYQIARNLVVDHYREKGKAQFISIDDSPIIDTSSDLEGEAILKSDVNLVRQAMAALKDDYQNVIIWHYLDDLPIREVAKMIGRTEETTRVLLHRALNSLKGEMSKTQLI